MDRQSWPLHPRSDCVVRHRYYTQKRLARAAAKLGHASVLSVHDQFEDRRVGVRMVTFVSPIQHLAEGGQVRCHHAIYLARVVECGCCVQRQQPQCRCLNAL